MSRSHSGKNNWLARPLTLVVVLGLVLLFGLGAADRASAAIGAVCPVPPSEVSEGIDLCVDRGDGATYTAGDRITICVSANIPTIAIFPPPPPPTIRVENVAADGSSRLLIEANMASGQQCAAGAIVAPFGQETIRARALNPDGTSFLEDVVTLTTEAR